MKRQYMTWRGKVGQSSIFWGFLGILRVWTFIEPIGLCKPPVPGRSVSRFTIERLVAGDCTKLIWRRWTLHWVLVRRSWVDLNRST